MTLRPRDIELPVMRGTGTIGWRELLGGGRSTWSSARVAKPMKRGLLIYFTGAPLPATIITASAKVSAPRLIVGSGSGAKKGEWLTGNGLPSAL